MNSFYTYAFLREDGSPYYIGKGKNDRIDSPKRNINLPPKDRRIYLKQNISEEEALKHEIYMIAVFGRKDIGTGILRNKTDGGEGVSGWVANERQKEKLSQSLKGKPKSAEQREKMSQSQKRRWELRKDRSVSQETREKMSKSQKGRIHSPESRKKMSESQSGKNHPLFGKKHSPETRKKMSESHKKKWI